MPNDTKPPIIFIHGLRCDNSALRNIATEVEKAGYPVYLLDRPGCGKNPELSHKNLKGYADWLRDYIESQHFTTKPVLVAHSLGTIIVSFFLELYPDLVADEVVLLSPICRTRRKAKKNRAAYYMMRFSVGVLPRPLQRHIMGGRWMVRLVAFGACSAKGEKRAEIIGRNLKVRKNFASPKAQMADVRMSTRNQAKFNNQKREFAIIGEKDRLTSAEVARRRAKLAGIDFCAIPNIGHSLDVEAPQEVASLILRFLGASDGSMVKYTA